MRLLKRFLARITDLFIPPVCLGCHRRIQRSEYPLCESCLEAVTSLGEEGICSICGSPMLEKECEVCWDSTLHFDVCRSLYRFDGSIQQLIHALKYDGNTAISKWFALKAADYVRSNPLYENLDLIMAVPLHRVRKRERGFNQADLIARQLAKYLGIGLAEPIQRKHYTLSQTHLSKEERLKNLKYAFGLKPKQDLKGKKILVLDDVFTTGSTVNEISKVLRAADPGQIMVLAMARA